VTKIWAFLTGKKTYIGGAIFLLVAALGLWYGQLDATSAGIILGTGLTIVGLRHGLDRWVALIIAELQAIKTTGKVDQKKLIDAGIAEALDRMSSAALTPASGGPAPK